MYYCNWSKLMVLGWCTLLSTALYMRIDSHVTYTCHLLFLSLVVSLPPPFISTLYPLFIGCGCLSPQAWGLSSLVFHLFRTHSYQTLVEWAPLNPSLPTKRATVTMSEEGSEWEGGREGGREGGEGVTFLLWLFILLNLSQYSLLLSLSARKHMKKRKASDEQVDSSSPEQVGHWMYNLAFKWLIVLRSTIKNTCTKSLKMCFPLPYVKKRPIYASSMKAVGWGLQ